MQADIDLHTPTLTPTHVARTKLEGQGEGGHGYGYGYGDTLHRLYRLSMELYRSSYRGTKKRKKGRKLQCIITKK